MLGEIDFEQVLSKTQKDQVENMRKGFKKMVNDINVLKQIVFDIAESIGSTGSVKPYIVDEEVLDSDLVFNIAGYRGSPAREGFISNIDDQNKLKVAWQFNDEEDFTNPITLEVGESLEFDNTLIYKIKILQYNDQESAFKFMVD